MKNLYKTLCIIFAGLDLFMFACIGSMLYVWAERESEPCTCAACEILSEVVEVAAQPSVGDDVLCYDYARGLVYSGFFRDDGDIQLRINPEGNLVIVSTIETVESKIIRSDAE